MHIVYLTINKINRKIYIGVHQTENDEIFDGYIGNGINIFQPSTNKSPKTLFQKAVKKYGFDSFIRVTLFRNLSEKEAYEIESVLVNEDFLTRDDVYNMKLGGIVAPDCSIEIHQYDLNGNYLKSWKSIDTASKELGCSGMSISYAHINKTISMNSLWSTEKLDVLNISTYKNIPQDKPVYKYDKNGKYLSYYRNSSEVAKELNTSRENVRDAIHSKYLCKKYYLSYEKFDKFIIEEKIKRSSEDKIYQYDLKGNFIKEFKNCEDASIQLNISKKSLQSKAASNKPYKGYQWSYEKLESLNNIENKSLSSKPNQVEQYTLEGEYIKTWETYSECRKKFPNVGKVLRGITKKCKGFTFKYKE